MHFNIYLDDATGQQLSAMAEETGETRNALIRKAVGDWLARQSRPQWPEAVIEFKGMEEMPRFEASRDQLMPSAEDPLA